METLAKVLIISGAAVAIVCCMIILAMLGLNKGWLESFIIIGIELCLLGMLIMVVIIVRNA